MTLYEMGKLSKQLSQARLDKWYIDFATWQFYFLLLCLVLPWLIWIHYARRHDAPRGVYFFGVLVALLTSFIDQAGVFYSLYIYPIKIFPFLDTFVTAYIGVVPVFYMFIYTYSQSWKQYLPALTVTAIFFSFVLEPLNVWIGVYIMMAWTYYYSTLVYLVVGLIAKVATDRLYLIK